MYNLCVADEDLRDDDELVHISENFRGQAALLVDMLDISIPVVAKLKVCIIVFLRYLGFSFVI